MAWQTVGNFCRKGTHTILNAICIVAADRAHSRWPIPWFGAQTSDVGRNSGCILAARGIAFDPKGFWGSCGFGSHKNGLWVDSRPVSSGIGEIFCDLVGDFQSSQLERKQSRALCASNIHAYPGSLTVLPCTPPHGCPPATSASLSTRTQPVHLPGYQPSLLTLAHKQKLAPSLPLHLLPVSHLLVS